MSHSCLLKCATVVILEVKMSNLGTWDILTGSSGAVCIHTFYLPLNRLACIERPHEAPVITELIR